MHRACKTRPGWTPTLAEDEEGMLASTPQVVLQREVDTLSSFWKAEYWAEQAWIPQERQPLPRMSTRGLREVALTFPAATASSIDGFHPRTKASSLMKAWRHLWQSSRPLKAWACTLTADVPGDTAAGQAKRRLQTHRHVQCHCKTVGESKEERGQGVDDVHGQTLLGFHCRSRCRADGVEAAGQSGDQRGP